MSSPTFEFVGESRETYDVTDIAEITTSETYDRFAFIRVTTETDELFPAPLCPPGYWIIRVLAGATLSLQKRAGSADGKAYVEWRRA